MQKISPNHIIPLVRMVNYFEVAPASLWGYRLIPDPEIILIVEGHFIYHEPNQKGITLHQGDVLWISPNIEHRFFHVPGDKPGVISCIHCELSPCGNWATNDYRLTPHPLPVTSVRQYSVIKELFWRANAIFMGFSHYRQAMLTAAVKQIILHLADYWRDDSPAPLSTRTDQMVAYIKANFAKPLTRQDIAKQFDLTPEYINALFKKELGITPTQLIHRQRIFHAYHLLKDRGMTIAQAAHHVGFNDPFHFSKVFKRIMLFNPSQSRTTKRPNPAASSHPRSLQQ